MYFLTFFLFLGLFSQGIIETFAYKMLDNSAEANEGSNVQENEYKEKPNPAGFKLSIGIQPYECLQHSDCPDHKPACMETGCMNNCENACGLNASCTLENVLSPICFCSDGLIGDPLVECMEPDVEINNYNSQSEEENTESRPASEEANSLPQLSEEENESNDRED